MKKTILYALIIAILAGGFLYWRKQKRDKEQRGANIQQVQVEEGPIEKFVEATGAVAPLNRVEIKPPIQGRIEKLLVDEGSKVKKGEILAWLSSSDRAAIMDAARAQGEKALKEWEDTYKPTPIMAPLSGVIILRNVVVGQTVDSGSVLFAMSDKLIVMTNVDEVDIGRVKMDMPAKITLDAYPDQAIQGRVTNILFEGKNVSNVITYIVKVEPKEEPPFFRSQMTANVHLILESKEKALLAPAAAVKVFGDGEGSVMVPGPDGKPQPKDVEVGIVTDQNVEILSGVNAGDTLLVVKRKYTPQKGDASNPLVMGRRRNQGQTQGQGQGGGSGQRRSN